MKLTSVWLLCAEFSGKSIWSIDFTNQQYKSENQTSLLHCEFTHFRCSSILTHHTIMQREWISSIHNSTRERNEIFEFLHKITRNTKETQHNRRPISSSRGASLTQNEQPIVYCFIARRASTDAICEIFSFHVCDVFSLLLLHSTLTSASTPTTYSIIFVIRTLRFSQDTSMLAHFQFFSNFKLVLLCCA